MRKVTRNPKIHVVVLENDVDYVKNSFESIFLAKKGNLPMKRLFLTMTTSKFEMLELFYREKDLCDILY